MADLELLETTLREIAPQADEAFAWELERRVENGFPRQRRRRSWRPPLVPALAAAGVLVALAVTGLVLLGGDETKTSALVARQESAPAGDAGTDHARSAVTAAPAQRKVERSIRLALATPRGKLADVASSVGEVASAHGGYVLSSSITTGSAGTRRGRFTLRIPSAQLEPALADLSGLGDVRERNESSQDLTAPLGHVQDRLAKALLERSATADRVRTATGAEAVRLRARLRELNAEIRTLGVELRGLRRRTSMSTVNVSLEEKAPKHEGGIAGGGPGDAFHDALAVMAGAFNLAIRLLPLALLLVLGWAGLAALRRRRREAALL